MRKIDFQQINWSDIDQTEHPGETGIAHWQTFQIGGLRIRKVNYSAGYKADHWCELGHVVHCLSGEFITEMKNGTSHILSEGMSYIVSDDMSSHRSFSENGVSLLIIDGDFLK